LKYVDGVNPISFLKLNVQIVKNTKRGILIGFLCVIWAIVAIGYQNVNFNIGIKYWVSALIVGFAEEIPFRGFLFQKLEEKLNFWKANCLSAFLFMAIHFPSYIFHNNKNMFIDGISVFIWGLVFGLIFNKTKSLLPSIISHSMYDLACFILRGK
jgi:membrane protease YdiL (CAAX protease family)